MSKTKQNKLPFEITDQIKRIIKQIIDYKDDFPSANCFIIKQYTQPYTEPEIEEDRATEKTEKNLKQFWNYLLSIKAVGGIKTSSEEQHFSITTGPSFDSTTYNKTNEIDTDGDRKMKLSEKKMFQLKIKYEQTEEDTRLEHKEAEVVSLFVQYNPEITIYNPDINKIKGLMPEIKQLPEPHQNENMRIVPKGTCWSDLTLKLLNDFDVEIMVKDQKVCKKTYDELGFCDSRTKDKNPNKQWKLLHTLSVSNNMMKLNNPKHSENDKLAKQIEHLTKKLKSTFLISEDPFWDYTEKKTYQTKFVIIPIPELRDDSELWGLKSKSDSSHVWFKKDNVLDDLEEMHEETTNPTIYKNRQSIDKNDY